MVTILYFYRFIAGKFTSVVLKVPIEVFAITTKICTRGVSPVDWKLRPQSTTRDAYALSFSPPPSTPR